jgi:DNA-directed RNA polymerase specialized sigma24 family protein
MPNSSPFPATRWTLLQALREGTEEDVQQALQQLCHAYWTPLYVVARGDGLNEADAKDMVQGFFELLLENESLQTAEQSRGMLRSFLLNSFRNFRRNVWREQKTLKRGGNFQILSCSAIVDDELCFLQIADKTADIETLYNREWARQILLRSLESLRLEHLQKGTVERFDLMVVFLTQVEDENTYAVAAEKIGISYNAFRQNLYRLRRSYREKIEDELAVTLGTRDPAVIRYEMMELFKAFE